jgi:hypothetical protein
MSCIQNFIAWNDVPEASESFKNGFAFFLTVLTNFSRPVRNVTLNVLSRATVRYLLLFALGQLRGSLQRRKMKILRQFKTINKQINWFDMYCVRKLLILNFEGWAKNALND